MGWIFLKLTPLSKDLITLLKAIIDEKKHH
jgi:hypothetical protein